MKLPHIVKYKDSLSGGSTKMFMVEIQNRFKDNKGLHAHEYEHVKQWYICLAIGWLLAIPTFLYEPTTGVLVAMFSIWIQGLLATFSKTARKYFEVAAYKKQIEADDLDHSDFYINALKDGYDLDITREEAAKLLYG
jgi:hypothetical protein